MLATSDPPHYSDPACPAEPLPSTYQPHSAARAGSYQVVLNLGDPDTSHRLCCIGGGPLPRSKQPQSAKVARRPGGPIIMVFLTTIPIHLSLPCPGKKEALSRELSGRRMARAALAPSSPQCPRIVCSSSRLQEA